MKSFTMDTFPCIFWEKKVFAHHQAIDCDSCGRWQHRGCGNTDGSFSAAVMSMLEASSRLSPTFLDAQCSIAALPAELLVHIFSYLNTRSLVACIRTCRQWRELINQSLVLWHLNCLKLQDSVDSVRTDRQSGLSWKETLQENYGRNGLKRQWRVGRYSNPHCYHALPDKPFCQLDTHSWGQVLEWELERS